MRDIWYCFFSRWSMLPTYSLDLQWDDFDLKKRLEKFHKFSKLFFIQSINPLKLNNWFSAKKTRLIKMTKKDDRIKMTEWEDCKRYIFFTLNWTENYNCKCYDEYEYDRKKTVNIYWPCFHNWQYCKHSFSVILILVVTFTVVIFGHI